MIFLFCFYFYVGKFSLCAFQAFDRCLEVGIIERGIFVCKLVNDNTAILIKT